MTPTPPEFNDVITRFTERLAKLRPEMAPHLDGDDDTAGINKLFAFQRDPDRQDAAVDDVTAINALIQRRN